MIAFEHARKREALNSIVSPPLLTNAPQNGEFAPVNSQKVAQSCYPAYNRLFLRICPLQVHRLHRHQMTFKKIRGQTCAKNDSGAHLPTSSPPRCSASEYLGAKKSECHWLNSSIISRIGSSWFGANHALGSSWFVVQFIPSMQLVRDKLNHLYVGSLVQFIHWFMGSSRVCMCGIIGSIGSIYSKITSITDNIRDKISDFYRITKYRYPPVGMFFYLIIFSDFFSSIKYK